MAATPDNHQQRIALTDAFVIGLAATRSILGDLPVAGLSREELGRWAAPGAARPGEFGRTWSRRSLFPTPGEVEGSNLAHTLGISAYTHTGVIGQPSQATKEKGLGALGHLGAAAGTLIGLLAPPHD